jgi:hypothetical protein
VVLPGLDLELEEQAWDEVGDAHPQGALKRLLERAGVDRADVRPWPASETAAEAVRGRSRRRVINEALRPAEVTDDWLAAIDRLLDEGRAAGVDPVAEGLDGLSLINARDELEAAGLAGPGPARDAGDTRCHGGAGDPGRGAGAAGVRRPDPLGDRGRQLCRSGTGGPAGGRAAGADGAGRGVTHGPGAAAGAGEAPLHPAGLFEHGADVARG